MTTPGPEHAPAVVVVPSGADSAAVVSPGAGDGRGSLARGGGLVAPALTLVNVVSYLLAVVASRALDQDGYGQLGALLAVLLVAAVPALGLQAVVARAVAADRDASWQGLLSASARTGAAVTLAGLVLAPLVASFLRVSVAGPLWLAAGLLPLVLVSSAQGLLQGAGRFGALAVLICVQALGKAVAVVPLALGGGPVSVMAALTLGTTVAAVFGLVQCRVLPRWQPHALSGLLAASGGLLALLVLSNVDLLLARNQLSDVESGQYAVGAVLTKAAFWLPQAVAVVAFPRLADAVGGRRVLRQAIGLVTALGLLATLACWVLAGEVLTLAFGQDYAVLEGVSPLFVLQGTGLALVQLLVYRGIAVRDQRATWTVVGVTVALGAVLLALPDPSVDRYVVTATVGAFVAALAVVLPELVRPER